MPGVRDIQDDPGTSYSARKYGSAEKTNQTNKNTDTNDGEYVKGTPNSTEEFQMAEIGTVWTMT